MVADFTARRVVGCQADRKCPGGRARLATLTLTIVDLLAITGAIIGPLIVIGGGALAWLRTDMAKLDERQRAGMAKLDECHRVGMANLDERQRAVMAKPEERLLMEIAKLDQRQRADTAAINMRLDALTQTIITSAIARGSQADLATERASQAAPTSATRRSYSLGASRFGIWLWLLPGRSGIA